MLARTEGHRSLCSFSSMSTTVQSGRWTRSTYVLFIYTLLVTRYLTEVTPTVAPLASTPQECNRDEDNKPCILVEVKSVQLWLEANSILEEQGYVWLWDPTNGTIMLLGPVFSPARV